MKPIYVVLARRWGEPGTHAYVVTATHNKELAFHAAKSEEQERGGKYVCEVTCISGDDETVVRKPYNGVEGPLKN
ncbi:MAG: hypothetical protein EOM59_18660 [Clostridia bacterium]|nr:hypothetical protein [Clostridia bacterium]